MEVAAVTGAAAGAGSLRPEGDRHHLWAIIGWLLEPRSNCPVSTIVATEDQEQPWYQGHPK